MADTKIDALTELASGDIVDADDFVVVDNSDTTMDPSGTTKRFTWASFRTGAATLTNKTLAFGSNTISGTLAQFQTAVTDGTLRAAGQETIWVPASAMVASTTNGAALTQVEFVTNDVDILLGEFDSATEEYLQFQIQMPKSWDEGTIIAQFIWSTVATSGDVIWALQATAIADDNPIDTAWGTAQTVTDTAKATASDIAITAETSAITVAGTPAAEEYVQFRVYRDADAAGDTINANDCRLHGVKIHYTTNAANDD